MIWRSSKILSGLPKFGRVVYASHLQSCCKDLASGLRKILTVHAKRLVSTLVEINSNSKFYLLLLNQLAIYSPLAQTSNGINKQSLVSNRANTVGLPAVHLLVTSQNWTVHKLARETVLISIESLV